jgi:hypothetical protein
LSTFSGDLLNDSLAPRLGFLYMRAAIDATWHAAYSVNQVRARPR